MFKKLLLTLCVGAFVFSCSDDDESSIKKADLIGAWEMTSSTDPEACEEEMLVFTDDDLQISGVCDGSEFSDVTSYTLSGKTLTLPEFDVTAKILQASNTTLKLEFEDEDDGEKYTTTYSKQ